MATYKRWRDEGTVRQSFSKAGHVHSLTELISTPTL